MQKQWRAVVITCSDRAARAERRDQSGPAVQQILAAEGYQVTGIRVVPDVVEAIAEAIVQAVDQEQVQLVLTTGGTGISARDVTPEATDRVTHKKLPGFGELMRARSLEKTAMAPLSRAQAAVRGSALIVNLPGSLHGATENLQAILHLIPHALELLGGKTEHERPDRP